MHKKEKYYLFLIVLYSFIFSVVMAFIVPPFESPDEQLHLSYINYISKYHELPDQYEGIANPEKFVGQGHQPPLYYIIIATLNYVVNDGQQISVYENPNYKHIWYGGTEGKVPRFNNYSKTPFTSSGDKDMFYFLRLVSALIGVATMIFIYKISNLIIEDRRYLFLSVFFAASLPQFAFINGVINNDSLAFMLSTISIYYIFRIIKNQNSLKDFILLGIFAGLSIICKKTLFFLLPGILTVFIFLFIRKKLNTAVLIKRALLVILLISVISFAYFYRNLTIYGDILGSKMEVDTMPQHVEIKSLFSYFFAVKFFPIIYHSFIGSFGWMNVKLPLYIYIIYTIIFGLSLYGYAREIKRKKTIDANYIIGLLLIVFCTSVIIYVNFIFTQPQGRYILPVVSAVSVLFSTGILLFNKYFYMRKYESISLITIALFFLFSDIISIITLVLFYYTPDAYL